MEVWALEESITENVKEIKNLSYSINEIIPLFKDVYTTIKKNPPISQKE